MRQAILGGIAAALLAAVVGLAVVAAVLFTQDKPDDLGQVLVIATAFDADGGLAAPLAFVLGGDGMPRALSTVETVTVPGTSARTARDAFPFVGGAGVAAALSPQTGGKTMEWVVLPEATWRAMLDDAGGVNVALKSSLSIYRPGKLTVIPEGRQTLSGDEAIALVCSAEYLAPGLERDVVLNEVVTVLASALRQGTLQTAVAEGRAESSLDPDALMIDIK